MEDINPTNNPEPVKPPQRSTQPKKLSMVIVIAITIAIFSFLGIYLLMTSQTKQSHTPDKQSSPTSKSSMKTIMLQVTSLKTAFAIDGIKPSYPLTITISAPEKFSDQLDAFGVSDLTVVGPKGWTGDGYVGADGSGGANFYPSGNNTTSKGAHITISMDPACIYCAYESAAKYFPEAAQWVQENEQQATSQQVKITGNYITPQLLQYRTPALVDEMEINGIAYFKVDRGQPYFIKMEITMTPHNHDLALFLLNQFIQTQHLTNKELSPTVSTPSTIPTLDISNWVTYINTKYKYSLKYPADWIVEVEGGSNPATFRAPYISSPCDYKNGEICSRISISIDTADNILETFLTADPKRGKVVQKTPLKVDKERAQEIIFLWNGGDLSDIVVTNHNDNKYILDYSETAKSNQIKDSSDWHYKYLFDQIISTFKFTN